MSVDDAIPGDIYTDKEGTLWRCMSRCTDPTVSFEAVEGYTVASGNQGMAGLMGAQNALSSYSPAPPIYRDKKGGAVRGLMFEGWNRIFRKGA